jgi:hypothetical protein
MKQTAIEDLETQIEKLRFQGVTEWQYGYQKALNEVLFLLKKAKEMEKDQIENAFDDGYAKSGITHNAQEYYNETYESK